MSETPEDPPQKIKEMTMDMKTLNKLIQPNIYIIGSDKHCQRCIHINTCLLAIEIKHLIKSRCRSYWEKPRQLKPPDEEELSSRDVMRNIEATWMALLAVIPNSCQYFLPQETTVTISFG